MNDATAFVLKEFARRYDWKILPSMCTDAVPLDLDPRLAKTA
jgi:hypothetical protein